MRRTGLKFFDEKTRKEFVAGFIAGAVCLGSAALILLLLFHL